MPRVLTEPWLSSYLKYVEATESPDKYKLWAGISALSSSLERNVFVKNRFIEYYPNQYVILVGPPGVGKGTAIHPAVDLVKKADTAHYLSDRITAEKIIDRLATGFSTLSVNPSGGVLPTMSHCCTIVAKELQVFLSSSDWMLQFLCQLWDENEFDYDTKHKGTNSVKNMCVGMLGACVPDYIRKINKDTTASVTGGFTSRCMFIYATKKSKFIEWETSGTTQIDPILEQQLVDDLRHIKTIKGEFKFTKEALLWWNDYLKKHDKLQETEFESEVVANFKARMPSHIVKTAMTMALSESDGLLIQDKHLIYSADLVTEVALNLDITFRSVGESPLAVAMDKIQRYLEIKGIASRSEILKDNYRHITDEDLGRVLMVLVNIGFCVEDVKGSKLIYRYIAKPGVKIKP